MAVKLIKKPTDYMSEMSYAYDVAKLSEYFDKSVYDALSASGNQDDVKQYVYGVAGIRDKKSDFFNKDDYEYLTSPEDKAAYTIWAFYGDKSETALDEATGKEYNIWEQQKAYFDQKIQAAIDKEAFDNMNEFDKVMNTVGGVVGNALNSVYGMVENILDLGTLVFGGVGTGFGLWGEGWEGVKKAASYDLTGTEAIQKALDEYTNKNTYIGKNKFATFVNDVASGISQYAVNAIPIVGPIIYWASMAGGFAEEALSVNPDIDFFSLAAYTAAGTGVGYGIEKLSSFAFGGTGTFIDKLTQGTKSKALTKLGETVSKNWVTKVMGAAVSEGLEESIEEFADTVLWNAIVAQNNSDLMKTVDFEDILYAGLVGGTIGGLMGAGRIATTQKVVKVADGRIVTKKYAIDNNLEITQEFNKVQTMNINEQLQQLSALTQTSQIADLRTKYSDLTDAQIQEQHEVEWKEASEYDEKVAKDIVGAVETLAKIHSVLGDERFKKITDIVNETYEKTQALGDSYLTTVKGQSQDTIEVTDKLRKIYGDGVSAIVNKEVSPSMRRLIQNLHNQYGIKAYSVDIGELVGKQGKLGLTISEDTILLDPKIFGNMSEQEILTKVVREELVHTLQFDGDVITPETLLAVQVAMGQNTDILPVELQRAYQQESTLTKLTEAQAKALAEVLLFDELTVSKMFYSQYDTLSKVYKKLKHLRTQKEASKNLRKPKEKLSYHELLVVLRNYRQIAALKIGTEANLNQIKTDWSLSDEEFKMLKDAYLPNENVAPIEQGEFLQTAAFAIDDTGLSQEARDVLYNEDGTPKTFYKGTNTKGITEFDSKKGEKIRESGATWLTDSLEVAKSYANERRDNATIYSVDLSKITNPKIIDAKGETWGKAFDGKSTDQIVLEAIAENRGYDAVIIKNVVDPGSYSTSRELLSPATDIAVIDNSKINILKETPKTSTTITTKTGTPIDLTSEINKIHKQFVKKAKRKRISKISAGVQLDIFDYIDEKLTEIDRETIRLKAVEQELDTIELRDVVDEKTLKDKADKLREICSDLVKSEYQGDIDNHKFATLSNEIFEKEASFFGEITSNEWQALYKYLITQLGDVRADAAANAVLRYGYLHRKQFSDIEDLIKVIYANKMSSSAQLMGLSSHDYNNHSIQSFVNEVAIQNKVAEIPLPKELLLKTAPQYASVDELTTAIENEIKDLTEQINNTSDPYEKWELNRQKASKERILTAIDDNEIALALDEQMATILESNENVTENLQKQADTYRAIIEWLLEHATFDKNKLSGFSDKKIPLSKNLEKAKTFFEGLESFRYMMMLSNPATAVKNAASNTLILGQSYIEDFGTKILEKSKWLSGVRQGSYTGEYDDNFSNWVKKTYLERVKSDSEGDKYTSNELRRLQQQYAEAKDPIKKNKLLNAIQTYERKMLSDKFWVTHRTMMNLTNTLAGTSNLILSDCEQWLINNYRNGVSAKDITKDQLINNISKTNKELADLYSRATGGDKIAVMELATKLNLDIVSPDLKKQNSIYYHSFYRANKMFFKIDNTFTRWSSDLGRRHPAIAYVMRHFIPFVRVTANATSYIIDRSPIGLAKGIFKALQTKNKWSYQKRYAIEHYYIEQYNKIMRENNPKFKFNQGEFETWLNDTVDAQTLSAINGDKQTLDMIFEQMVKQGMVNSGQIGSDNLFSRAESMELISQGFLGTALMGLGVLLGMATDAFDYDDEELYGPVVKIGDIKIGIGDLSPFSTLFTIGAMLKNDNIDNKMETVFEIFADATVLSTLDSALSYSNGAWDYFKNQSVNIVAQYQPAITKAISKIVHNTKKDKSGSWGEKLLKTIAANSLLFNYLVPDKINPYTGEPEKYYSTGWFEGLFDVVLPVGLRVDGRSGLEKEAEMLGTETTGLSGSFTINNNDYKLTGKTKEKYAKYKANYIENRFTNILNGTEKVTIKDEKTGKYKTVKYSSLNNEEKQRVLKNLYTTGTTVTKIKYWLDSGNSYVVTDRDQYYEYKKLFGDSAKIIYRNKWSGSKFVEG